MNGINILKRQRVMNLTQYNTLEKLQISNNDNFSEKHFTEVNIQCRRTKRKM